MNIGFKAQKLQIDGPNGSIVHGIDFEIESGAALAIIGESGSGKTMTARAITGLLPPGVFVNGSIQLGNSELLLPASPKLWEQIRGKDIALLLQDPFTSLSPVHKCGEQISMTIRSRISSAHPEYDKKLLDQMVSDEVLIRLDEVNLPHRVVGQYPHELSGGMRQRVAIAAAIAAEPKILIADEPTSALDASTQTEILDLICDLQKSRGMTLILISHDLGIVQKRADRVLVMRLGEVVEAGTPQQIFETPQHSYTKELLAANPSVSNQNDSSTVQRGNSLLTAHSITKSFGQRRVLHDASVSVGQKEIVALLGESGSGKTTLARCIAGLEMPSSGEFTLDGVGLSFGRKGRLPSEIQIVFQDPYSTLNPFFTIGQTLAEALSVAGRSQAEVSGLLALVGLSPDIAHRRPAQLSGGQRQRVAIARALAPQPKILICDEAVSALDVTIQAQILKLLVHLRDELNLSILFISHDLAVVSRICDYVYVMHNGEIVEEGSTRSIMNNPRNPATIKMVAAAKHESIKGIIASSATSEESD